MFIKNINFQKAYIDFVNKVQESVYNSPQNKSVYMTEDYTYKYFDDPKQLTLPKNKKFRFFGYSFKGANKQEPKK